ncbi:hypothetical protein [Streptomyces sp. KAU_LT]|uniref:hypothetical protein n=1 Tax=Streptomyces sp. KAU_LT TaxID=3046669 RepID=UPI0024B8027A|nr:hypothetical protein [Streptomyces sp. KAU_LT]MDI9829683.1 hypothetical protein [Streptomyces sp. KAU_LT]
MSVEVRLDQGFIGRLLRARGSLARRRFQERLDHVARIAAAEAPGSMGQYIETDIRYGARGLEGAVICTHPKARLVIEGTRPHLIRPRRARALRFEVGGDVVFTQLVRHPGTRPNNFLARALRQGR